MADNTSISAVYSANTGSDASASSPLSRSFLQAITIDPSAVGSSKEQYLTALASSLSTLQDSINTGLTEILVQQGVLDAAGENAPEKNKVRTKVPGQPNNGKKGQTKKQQQREQQQQEQQPTTADAAAPTAAANTASESTVDASGDSESVISMDVDSSVSSDPLDQYKPKGGIYGGEDEELDQDKDEVDLVMEADPGEVEGACLELPKEATTATPSTAEKRSGVLDDMSAAAKKSRSEDAS
ncbi:hypothetical protein EMPS_01591 [Entomortierella parvispora]|uniref:EKC/KEOPS complex subunit GON7 n=1 Tax=Entomortierella parvispora TaxID=205924 RepID=A0A9P3H3B5_9FUNG|nr:hypothetical protein EMPS_01591 [Entomortierella parvispora]